MKPIPRSVRQQRKCFHTSFPNRRCTVQFATLTIIVVFGTLGVRSDDTPGSTPHLEWQRTGRVSVYDSPRRARYPSVVKTDDGSLLVLFTRQTEVQERTGRGDLMLVRSTDDGRTWSEPVMVYQGTVGEPRAVGTMTKLSTGRIIVPLAEMCQHSTQSKVQLLESQQGKKWRLRKIAVDIPLIWWAPCGLVVETTDGTLVMAVYGATNHKDLRLTI